MLPTGSEIIKGPARLAIRQPDGSYKDLGEVRRTDGLSLSGGDAEPIFTNGGRDLSFTVEIPATELNLRAAKRLINEAEKDQIKAVVAMIRKVGLPLHFECRKSIYRHFSALVHKHYGMNFTRYCRAAGVGYFRGFRVYLGDGGTDICK